MKTIAPAAPPTRSSKTSSELLKLVKALASPAVISRGTAAFVVLIGCLVLLGWLLDWPALKSLHPSFVSMKPNTALLFIFSGACCWLSVPKVTTLSVRRMKKGTVAFVILVAGLTLVEWMFGVELGIDQLLFRDAPGAVGTLHPGRPTPWTALAFLMFIGALLLLDARAERARDISSWLALFGGVIALLSLTGYAYGAELLYGVGLQLHIAVQTGVGFLFLTVALLFARPDQGLMAFALADTPGGRMVRRLLPGLVLILFTFGWLEQVGLNARWFDAPLGTALVVLVGALVSAGLITWNALTVNQLDSQRHKAEVDLQTANTTLEARVAERTGAAGARARELLRLIGDLQKEVAERQRSEEQVRRANSYNRSLLEASLDPLVTIGSDGKITDVNAATEAATERTRSELVGTDFADYFTKPDQARAGYQRVFSEGAVRHYPLELRSRDGQVISVLYNAAVFRDEVGKVVGVFAAARDVTQRKQAEENVRRLAQLQSAIAELGQRALRTETLTGLLDDAVQAVARNLDVDLCNILEILPGAEELLLRAGVGWKEGMIGHARVKALGTQPGYVIRSERPVIVQDARTEARFALLPNLLGEDVVSAMSVVISTSEGPYGALGVHSRRLRTFTQDEVHFLEAVANVLGSAIQRQRSQERLRRSNRALRSLSNCNQALIRATDETALLQQICQIVVEQAGYRLCWVGYAEQDEAKTVRPVAQAGFEEGYLQNVKVTWADTERGRGPTGTCIRTGQTVMINDMAADPRFTPWRADALKRGYASSIAIPLANSTPFGALTIYAAEPEAFSAEDVALLTELAGDLAFGVTALRTKAERNQAVALQAAHEREAKIGAEIQQTLLGEPLPTDLRGLRVAALSVPSEKIDGDFYSFYKHEDQRLDLIVADVMGKGIPAALLGAATKSHFLEALCHLLDVSPAGVLPEPKEIVTLAHADMAEHLIDLESFVTLCYLRIDADRHVLDFVDAGHTGVIHCKAATGRCEVLHGDNLPMGFRQGEIYSQQSVSIELGDLLVLYSDGITEARNRADELFGQDRLTQCIESNSGLEPEDLSKAIRSAVFAFAESETPTDDLTCVVIKIVASELSQASAQLQIRSDFQDLGRAREFVRDFCRDLPGTKRDEDFVGKIELAVTEACSNIMKHAYHGRTDQQIHLEAEGYPDRISIRLHHLGEPFDPSNVPPPRLDGSQESGFGVYLITQSMDGVRYYRDERGRNCIALTKNR